MSATETDKTTMVAQCTLQLPKQAKPKFTSTWNDVPVEKWGCNFAGSITVHHGTESGNKSFTIYVPGQHSYDPAGATGDPHASERIGSA